MPARFHNVAASAEQLAHEFAEDGRLLLGSVGQVTAAGFSIAAKGGLMSILGVEEIISQKPKQLLLALVLLLFGGLSVQATADQVRPESVSHSLATKKAG